MMRDKLLHLLVGAAIGFCVSFPLSYFGNGNLSVFIGVLAASVVGATKEAFDYSDGGLFDVRDWVSTSIGGGFGSTLAWLVAALIRSNQ